MRRRYSQSELFTELYRRLSLIEDYFLDGFRHEHPPLAPESAGRPSAGKPPTAQPGAARPEAAGPLERRASPSGTAPAGRPAEPSGPKESLEQIAGEISVCTLCALHEQRKKAVPGQGVMDPQVMIIGEGPGSDEDRTGIPFVGRAGQYLDRWLAAIDLDRKSNCFITNIVKCRPPGNRDPLPEESATCLPYLERQIDLLQPKAILSLGRISAQILTGRGEGIGRLRGRRHEYRGIPLIATYHPSAVLRNPELRAPVWTDLKSLRALLDDLGFRAPHDE